MIQNLILSYFKENSEFYFLNYHNNFKRCLMLFKQAMDLNVYKKFMQQGSELAIFLKLSTFYYLEKELFVWTTDYSWPGFLKELSLIKSELKYFGISSPKFSCKWSFSFKLFSESQKWRFSYKYKVVKNRINYLEVTGYAASDVSTNHQKQQKETT